jgi:hypothetical protein
MKIECPNPNANESDVGLTIIKFKLLAHISPNLELNYSLLLFQCLVDTSMLGIDLKKIVEKMGAKLKE